VVKLGLALPAAEQAPRVRQLTVHHGRDGVTYRLSHGTEEKGVALSFGTCTHTSTWRVNKEQTPARNFDDKK